MNVVEDENFVGEAMAIGDAAGIKPFSFFVDPATHKTSWRRLASDADAATFAEQNGLVVCDEPRKFETARL